MPVLLFCNKSEQMTKNSSCNKGQPPPRTVTVVNLTNYIANRVTRLSRTLFCF